MDKFDSISPLDYRYVGGELGEKLVKYLSENAAIRYRLDVEVALAYALAEHGICSKEIASEIEAGAKHVTAQAVYDEEKRIKHDIRALVNCMRKEVSKDAKPYIHFTATSNDIIHTAEGLRLKDATEKVLIPELLELEKSLISLARREKGTLQIGRTHGQHAEPITFGHTIASYVARIGGRIVKIQEAASNMRGKFSGSVGAYNASSMFVDNPEEFEATVLKRLGMTAGSHSTQLVEAEYALDLLHAVTSSLGVMANIGDDMRHLQRSEIAEVAEAFGTEQVGSSTMPHKRNPINFENVKSLWKEFMPRMNTVYMDQISEHQRDLTNSASSRFNTEIIAATIIAANRLNRVMSKLVVDKKNLQRNFDQNKDMIAAEPSYILLSFVGHPDAHEAIRKITLEAEKSGKAFSKLLLEKSDLKKYFEKMSEEQMSVLENPENYIGISDMKTEKVCKEWEEKLGL